MLHRDLLAFVWALLGVLVVQSVIQACTGAQLKAAHSAADAICVAAEAWESDAPEVTALRALCASETDLRALHRQLDVCLATAE